MEQSRHRLGTGQDGRHGSGSSATRLLHGPPAFPGQFGQLFGTQDARGVECYKLAIAMAGYHVGLEPDAPKQPQHSDAGCTNGGLGHVGLHQGSTRSPPACRHRSGRREDERTERRPAIPSDHALKLLERTAHLREHDGQLSEHVG